MPVYLKKPKKDLLRIFHKSGKPSGRSSKRFDKKARMRFATIQKNSN